MIKLEKYFKKIRLFEIVLQTNNFNSIINDTISSSNTSHDFNLIMDETLIPSLSQASIILDDLMVFEKLNEHTQNLGHATPLCLFITRQNT